MEKELIKYIEDNCLKPFGKNSVKNTSKSIFRTKDAKSIYDKAINFIQKNFYFYDTSNILEFFSYVNNQDIEKKQEFFNGLIEYNYNNLFLKSLKEPKPFWNPDYDIIVVTEEDSTFKALKDLGCNVRFIVNEQDILELERYDTIQVLDCDNFTQALERLPQTIFLKSLDEAYLERHVRTLSGWMNNLNILEIHDLPQELKKIISELKSLFFIFDKNNKDVLTREKVEDTLEIIKEEISN